MHPLNGVLLIQHFGMATDDGRAKLPLVLRLDASALD